MKEGDRLRSPKVKKSTVKVQLTGISYFIRSVYRRDLLLLAPVCGTQYGTLIGHRNIGTRRYATSTTSLLDPDSSRRCFSQWV